jgi:hypothetical protein
MYKIFRVLFYAGLVLLIAGVILGKYYFGPWFGPYKASYAGEFVLSMPGSDYKLLLKTRNYDSIQDAMIALRHDIYSNVVAYLSEKSGNKLSPFFVILYFDGYLSDSSHFNASDIKAFSAYSIQKGIYFHRLFLRDGNSFVEKPYYSSQVLAVMCNHSYLIAKNVLRYKKVSYLNIIDIQRVFPRSHKYVREVLTEKLEKANL